MRSFLDQFGWTIPFVVTAVSFLNGGSFDKAAGTAFVAAIFSGFAVGFARNI